MLQLVPESGETRFLVHADLLASQSECLRNLIKEIPDVPSAQRQLHMVRWDAATVGRFVEFMYTGDYHCPDPVPLDTPVATPAGGSVSGHGGEEEPADEVAIVPPLSPSPEQDSDTGGLKPQFQLPQLKRFLEPGLLAPLSGMFASGGFIPQRKLSAAETYSNKFFCPAKHDFEEVFLTHAKTYVIALMFEVQDLCVLALQRLARALVNIDSVPPDSLLVSNFIELARYAYSATTKAQDPLREVVSQFAALNFTSIQTQEMSGLMGDGGGFPGDLMEKISVRFVASEELRKGIPPREDLEQEMGGLRRRLFLEMMKSKKYLKEIERLEKESGEESQEELKNEMKGLKSEFAKGRIQSQEIAITMRQLKDAMEELREEMEGC